MRRRGCGSPHGQDHAPRAPGTCTWCDPPARLAMTPSEYPPRGLIRRQSGRVAALIFSRTAQTPQGPEQMAAQVWQRPSARQSNAGKVRRQHLHRAVMLLPLMDDPPLGEPRSALPTASR